MNRLVAALVLCALMGGCGYNLGEIRQRRCALGTLAVPTFKTRTYEPRVEVLMADTLIKTLKGRLLRSSPTTLRMRSCM
jgi:hypothetical protein